MRKPFCHKRARTGSLNAYDQTEIYVLLLPLGKPVHIPYHDKYLDHPYSPF